MSDNKFGPTAPLTPPGEHPPDDAKSGDVDDGSDAPAVPTFGEVYDELRGIAAVRLASESPGQTLTATALVNEAYVRLFKSHPNRDFASRNHLIATAAGVMRHILTDRARRKGRTKHGGNRKRLDLRQETAVHDLSSDHLLDLTDALEALAIEDTVKAKLVELLLFGGLSIEEAADALDISRETAVGNWKYARAWLRRWLAPLE